MHWLMGQVAQVKSYITTDWLLIKNLITLTWSLDWTGLAWILMLKLVNTSMDYIPPQTITTIIIDFTIILLILMNKLARRLGMLCGCEFQMTPNDRFTEQ